MNILLPYTIIFCIWVMKILFNTLYDLLNGFASLDLVCCCCCFHFLFFLSFLIFVVWFWVFLFADLIVSYRLQQKYNRSLDIFKKEKISLPKLLRAGQLRAVFFHSTKKPQDRFDLAVLAFYILVLVPPTEWSCFNKRSCAERYCCKHIFFSFQYRDSC